jgi:hypothetical protein
MERILGFLAVAFVAMVLLSILANPTSRDPLEWMWPPTAFKRIWEILTRPNYVSDHRSVNPVLGASMG